MVAEAIQFTGLAKYSGVPGLKKYEKTLIPMYMAE